MKRPILLFLLALPLAFSCSKPYDFPASVPDTRGAWLGTFHITDSFLIQYSKCVPPISTPDNLSVSSVTLIVSKDTLNADQLMITYESSGVNSIYWANDLVPYKNGIAFNILPYVVNSAVGYVIENFPLLTINKKSYSGYILPNGNSKEIKFKLSGTCTNLAKNNSTGYTFQINYPLIESFTGSE